MNSDKLRLIYEYFYLLDFPHFRPRLFNVEDSKNILVENFYFLNSPYWTFWVHGVDGLEVRFCEIRSPETSQDILTFDSFDFSARRTDQDHHGIIDLTAFNTDGFDVTGKNVWIHDCTVWDQDDCIAVKVITNPLLQMIQQTPAADIS